MTTLGVGTAKGGWLLRRDDQGGWAVEGPTFPGWEVTAFGRAADGTHLAATGSGWFGPGIHRSQDLITWSQVKEGPGYADSGPALQQIWTFTTGPDGRIWCGVAEAGVFTSDDHGQTWQPLEAFNGHPTRHAWEPGAGGMCAHRILLDGKRVWVGASAVGVFRSDDGGASIEPFNDGIDGAVPGGPPGIGFCVHGIVADPDDPDRIWRQDHTGVYRTSDGGGSWQRIEHGLPAAFGFPIVRDAASGALFVVPLTGADNRTPVGGRFAAWRSTDGGDTWHQAGTGWPDGATWTSVLRGAMATDGEGGVYLGTTGGQVWATTDAGDTWQRLPGTFPRIAAVAVM
ncbi:MAG TPA: hypothetical protein VMM13_09980 [Euzebya sp.]|nr:hypothetical protein [Euzebya sp.]